QTSDQTIMGVPIERRAGGAQSFVPHIRPPTKPSVEEAGRSGRMRTAMPRPAVTSPWRRMARPIRMAAFFVGALCHLDAWLVDRRPTGGRFDTRAGVPPIYRQ